jgi:hypothetical protein
LTTALPAYLALNGIFFAAVVPPADAAPANPAPATATTISAADTRKVFMIAPLCGFAHVSTLM